MTSFETREKTLEHFINTLETAIYSKRFEKPRIKLVVDQVFAELRKTVGCEDNQKPSRLPVCKHLDMAFFQSRKGPKEIVNLTDALISIEERLKWKIRGGEPLEYPEFYDGHANAVIIGHGGLEIRKDLTIGVSLLAPETIYPKHRHLPEEIYIVLADGKWMQGDSVMALKTSGELIHNPPNIWHAMESLKFPLLAIWCLWGGAAKDLTIAVK